MPARNIVLMAHIEPTMIARAWPHSAPLRRQFRTVEADGRSTIRRTRYLIVFQSDKARDTPKDPPSYASEICS
jgi:hypothetical protein